MHRRIKELANGVFEYEKPIVNLSVNRLDLKVQMGDFCKGSFHIQGLDSQKINGIIYTSNSRMICLVDQFEGDYIEIPYEFDTTGLSGGDFQNGKIYIVSNGGEYTVSFTIDVEQTFGVSSIGKVKNLFHFANLAQINWEEAFKLFYSKDFAYIFEKKERAYKVLYQIFSSGNVSEQNMEEFLIAVNKKSQLKFKVEQVEGFVKEFEDLEENVLEKIKIIKSNWGYLCIEVKTDAPFILMDKTIIETNDFVGKSYAFEYIIEVDKLHTGKNFGSITFSCAYDSIEYPICVKKEIDIIALEQRREKKKKLRRLIKQYVGFRMKNISASMWAKDTITYLERLHNLEGKNQWYELLQAQARLVNQQRDDATWLLERYEIRNEKKEKDPEQYGYYLYLTTLCNPDKDYINEVTLKVKGLYQENQNSWCLIWILLFLDEELEKNRSKKLQVIEEQIIKGCNSPVLYIEAYYIMLQDSFLLNHLGRAQLKILSWTVKQEALTQDMANQLFHLAAREKRFDSLLYRILDATCERYTTKENLGILCGYLIKADRFQNKYFKWYAKAVEEDLRITRLYEYYMMALGENEDITIPKIVLMYFRYNSQLDYRRKAYLYEYILKHKEEYGEIYRSYRPLVERFVIDQILEEHFDEHLAYLYQDVLTVKMLTPELAKALSHLLFVSKITCDNKNMKQVVICHLQLKEEQVIPLVDAKAYISMFSDDCEIVFQDKQGRRYGKEIKYKLTNFMPKEALYQECLRLFPLSIELALFYIEKKKNFKVQEERDLNILCNVEKSKQLKEEFKREIRTEIIYYYHDNNMEYDEKREEFFLKLKYNELTILERSKVIELLIFHRKYDKAFEIIRQYGGDRVSVKLLLRLCSNFILQEEEQVQEVQEDTFLTKLSHICVVEGKYNETVLKYLIARFNGTMYQMIEVWELAEQFEMETFELAERIIVQMLFTRDYLSKVDKIFDGYYAKGARRKVKEAYFSYHSYEYFVGQRVLSDKFIQCLKKEYLRKEELSEICKLGLFKGLSEKKLDEKEGNIVKELLEFYIAKDMYFKFYQNFPISITNCYQLNDKHFIEYKTGSKNKVELHYKLNTQDNQNTTFVVEDMPHMFEGIFVKVLTLFFGENLQYYISEVSSKNEMITESTSISKSDLPLEQQESRYDLLNEIVLSYTLQDERTMVHMMEQFMERDYVSKLVFKIK